MTGGLALVGAVRSDGGAELFADFAFDVAFVFVARFDALVPSTWQWFGARKATAEGALEARDCLSLFVFAVAVLGGEDDTRRAIRFRVTVVENRMGAEVPPGAGLIAMRFLRSTRHWWIDDACSTLAGQLVERNAMARLAGTFVTWLIATMSATGQHLGTGFRADVVKVDAALLVALVLGTTSHSVATFLASGIVGTCLKLFAFHLLIHVTTATLYHG